MTGNGNGYGWVERPEPVGRPAHADIARWLLLSCVDYDGASNDTLAVLASAHATLAVADALGAMMLQRAALAHRADD